jgi:hypothetical protein
MDCLDGSGPSGVFMNALKGYIWVIHGVGMATGLLISRSSEDDSQQQRTIVLHRFHTSQAVDLRAQPTRDNHSELWRTDTLCRLCRVANIRCSGSSWRRVWGRSRRLSRPPLDGSVFAASGRWAGLGPVLLNTIDVFGHLGDCFQSGHGDPTDRCCMGGSRCYDDQRLLYSTTTRRPQPEDHNLEKGAVRSHAKMAAMCNCLDFYLTEEDVLSVL